MPQLFEKRKLALLMTGDEVLYGDITDTNSALIAKAFEEFGFRTVKKRVVGDDLLDLKTELIDLVQVSDILVINGGLGSTVDDKTNQAISQAFKLDLEKNTAAQKHVESHALRPIDPGSSLHKQCFLPAQAQTFTNPVGSALGYWILIQQTVIIATPGPPRELAAMLDEAILPWARNKYPTQSVGKLLRFLVIGIGESKIERTILDHFKNQKKDPFKHLRLGFRAVSPFTEIKLWGESGEQDLLYETEAQILKLFPDHCFSRGPELPKLVSSILAEGKHTLSLAESCTGGLLASMITALPGASQLLLAGIVSYAYDAKEQFLGVEHQTLLDQGAVSAEVAEQMHQGVLARSKADFGISITGIAGPSGGMQNKPVGTVYITVGSAKHFFTRRLIVIRERTQFQRYVALTALDLLRRFLLNLDPQTPYYYDEVTKDKLHITLT